MFLINSHEILRITQLSKEKEMQEAIDAGEKALSSAYSWGAYDTLFGGGLISSVVKHSHMDDAKASITKAEKNLKVFSDELKDIELDEVNLETNDTLGITDVIFDDMFSDLLMQDRIEAAQEKVNKAIKRVEEIMQTLNKQS